MWKIAHVLLLGFALEACIVQTESLDGDAGPPGQNGATGSQGPTGPTGPPGVSPFSYVPNTKDIYYADGNVGLGTMLPTATLDVAGHLHLSSDAVNHGVTDFIPTNVYGLFGPCRAQGGGLCIDGFNDPSATDNPPIKIAGILQDELLTGPTGQVAAVEIWSLRRSGAGVGPLSPAGKIFAIKNFNSENTTEVLTVSGAGNVGIGATAPTARLDVNGIIRATAQSSGTNAFEALNTNSIPVVTIGNHSADNGILQIFEANGVSENVRLSALPGAPMWLNSGGNVGIGTSAPTYKLEVSGTLRASSLYLDPAGCQLNCPSDVRLKQNIVTLPDALAKLLRLRGVTYEWREPSKHANQVGPQIGMIAQEVEQVFPQWVGTNADGHKTLNIRGFEALAVEGLRELKHENETLKTVNERLVAENSTLDKRVSSLEARLAAIDALLAQQRGEKSTVRTGGAVR